MPVDIEKFEDLVADIPAPRIKPRRKRGKATEPPLRIAPYTPRRRRGR